MAGYADDWSMSNNAIDAYDRGLRPRSKWSKADILDALPTDARTYLQLDEYPLEFLREYFLEVEEWHHTSKHYNRTDFCRPSIAHWSTSTTEDVQNLYIVWLQRQQKVQAAKTAAPRKVRVTYTHWIDKRTHKTVTEYALVRGSWIYTQSGLRKRADGTNIRVDETYKRAPRGTAQIFQEIERRMNGGGANGAKAGAQPVDDYYANKVRHHLQNKLRMTDADPAPVTAWAEAVGRASKAEKRVLERRNIEHHGVLVDGDGTICGYTESAPSVDELGRVTWDSYTLTPETCTAAGVPPTRRVSVGCSYWFSHPNLADGKTLAHVTFPEVGLGSARDKQGRIKH